MEDATKIPSNASAALKAGEFGYPSGHLGHLTEPQQSALVDFKKLCTASGLYKPASDGQPPSHSDAVLLRFLRARRFIPKDAQQQFQDTEKWRKVNEIDKVYENIDIENYDEARRLYPQWLGRRDKRGIPVYLFEVKPLDSKTMAAYAKSGAATAVVSSPAPISNIQDKGAIADIKATPNSKTASSSTGDESGKTPPRLLRLFALYENLAGFMSTLCTVLPDRPYSETPVVQSNNIVDISGVGLKQFWNLRGHMQDASVLATAHYPETLDRIFIVGAPSFFPTVWTWIKRWFDPITVSKIFILSSSDVLPTLSNFIDPENIPQKFGGKLDFRFGDLPSVDPAYADKIEWKYAISETPTTSEAEKEKEKGKLKGLAGSKKETDRPVVRRWPKGPVEWVERGDGDLDLVAVGSEGGKLRREVVATMRLDGVIGGKADPSGPLQGARAGTRAAKGDKGAEAGAAQSRQSEAEAEAAQNAAGLSATLPSHPKQLDVPAQAQAPAGVQAPAPGAATANGHAAPAPYPPHNYTANSSQAPTAQLQPQQQQHLPFITADASPNGGTKSRAGAQAESGSATGVAATAVAAAVAAGEMGGMGGGGAVRADGAPAVEPVPLAAVSTALPGEGEKL